MTCAEMSALVPLHLSGELDPSRASEFVAHLESCPACAEEVRNQKSFDADLRSCLLAGTIDTDALDRRVRQRILMATRRRFVFGAAAFAAIALIMTFGYRAMFRPAASGVYAAAARDHHSEVVERRPRRWQSDPASVKDLAKREGISASAIGALAPVGYRFEEGKLCRLDGKVFLHLVYTDGAKNFSVFLRRKDDENTSGTRIDTSDPGAEHVAGFENGDLKALIVTNQPGDAALLLAKFAAAVI